MPIGYDDGPGTDLLTDEEDADDNLTFDQQVDEALSRLPQLEQQVLAVHCEPTESDKLETDTVRHFMAKGCGCQRFSGRQCSLQFTTEHVLEVRSQCLELSRSELDMVLLGQVMASMNVSDTVVTESRHRETTRERPRTSHSHQGKAVCAHMFRFLHTVGK